MSSGILHTTNGMGDVIAERVRQIKKEGFDHLHDDCHTHGELAQGAAVYSLIAQSLLTTKPQDITPEYLEQLKGLFLASNPGNAVHWPWRDEELKVVDDPRKLLVKAGAMILAQIDIIDRAAGRPNSNPFVPHGNS